jgi:GT2 family glycosyltransferase
MIAQTTCDTLSVSFIVHGDYTYIGGALRSLFSSASFADLCVYVVINAGDQAQTEELKLEFPQVEYIINEIPQGFAANHNMVMQLTSSEFIALLNDDIALHDTALDTLLACLRKHPDVGLVGGQLLNPDGSKQVSVYSDPGLFRTLYKISGLATLTHQHSKLRGLALRIGINRLAGVESLQDHHTMREVPIVKGAAMVVRRAAYEEVGGMDETTLAYGEEYDWHLRLRQKGWQIMFVPEARITHYGLGQATLHIEANSLVEDRKANLYYYLKHRPAWQALVVRAAIVISHTFWGLFWLAINRKKSRTHFSVTTMAWRFTPA